MNKTTYPKTIKSYNKKPKINLGKQIKWWREKCGGGYGSFDVDLYTRFINVKEKLA